MSNSDVLNLIQNSISTVTSTSLFEGQPTLLCEASSLGVPSIFPNSGGIVEFFPKDYGLSFNYDSEEDLILKLSKVTNHPKMSEYGNINNKFISKLLNKDEMFDRFEKNNFKMSNQLVSIIMSVYNNEDTVKASIESILSQSYKNIELIITDDCSSDRSLSIIKNYLDEKNVKLIENSDNKGLTKSLNTMIKVASGEFIARQDADDISLEKRIEVQVELINKFNLDFVSSRAISIQTNKFIPNISFYLPYKFLIKYKNPFVHGTLMIKKDVLLKLGSYDERFKYAQDYKLMIDAIDKQYKFKVLRKPYYKLNTKNNISNLFKHQQEHFADCARRGIDP